MADSRLPALLVETPTPRLKDTEASGALRTSPLFDDVMEMFSPSVVVEFGSWQGASAIAWVLASRRIGLDCKVVCIDTWLGSPEHWADALPDSEWSRSNLHVRFGEPQIFDRFCAEVHAKDAAQDIRPLRATTECATIYLNEVGFKADCVYVDADHSLRGALSDLRRGRLILSENGILAADDWNQSRVRLAVCVYAFLTRSKIFALPGQDYAFVVTKRSQITQNTLREKGYRNHLPFHAVLGVLKRRLFK